MLRNLVLIAVALSLQGCICDRTEMVADKWPTIVMPARPTVAAGDANPSLSAVMEYARQLETGIKAYNQQAGEHNVANGYPETDLK